MAELILEPYAAVQHWRLPGADGHWESILGQYLQTLAQRCTTRGQSVVGHIKAIALLPNQSYLRVSVIAPDIPASIEGKVPLGCIDLELTLNVLVYGVQRTVIERITQDSASEIAEQWKGAITHKSLNQSGQHSHHSNHPEGEII